MITVVVPPVPAPVTVTVMGISVSERTVRLTPSTVIVCCSSEICVISAVSGSAIATATGSDHADILPDADETRTARRCDSPVSHPASDAAMSTCCADLAVARIVCLAPTTSATSAYACTDPSVDT